MRRPRSDKGKTHKSRGAYNSKKDMAGKIGKEPALISAFWRKYKVEDFMAMSPEEAEKVIEAWMLDYQERRIKQDRHWWYPPINTHTLNDIRNKRTGLDKTPRVI